MTKDSPSTRQGVDPMNKVNPDALLGLGTKRNGSIYFDTPLASEMVEYLRASAQQQEKENETS